MIRKLINGLDIDNNISRIIATFHTEGPVARELLEQLAYYKKYHPEKFSKYEARLMNVMGLFYKTEPAKNILEEVYSIYAQAIIDDTGDKFTPVQADAFNRIMGNKYFSFSAPTSAGKSYLFRKLIQETMGDIVIIVPSRALISEYYYEIISLVEKDVLVLQFIEDINTDLTNRRIFIITPERGNELFKQKNYFNIDLFLLDEAQLSEEEYRGLKFDAFVRRIDRVFPNSRKIFAHPFVNNPEAQLSKHQFYTNSDSKRYDQQTVGKLFIHYHSDKFTYFSPNSNCEHVPMHGDIAADILNNGGTLLIYISKNKIYDGTYRLLFGKYIDLCHKLTDEKALSIIKELKNFIGAKDSTTDKHSNLIDLMEKGVVTHHGSMPLKARLMVEKFIKEGLARICFATSTLNQGINMPFDAVWIDNYRNVKDLTLKNLIGRAGRTSQLTNTFDFGYTIIKSENVHSFSDRYRQVYSINPQSRLDEEINTVDEDEKDLIDAIKTDSFDDDLFLPKNQIERIKSGHIDGSIQFILDTFIKNGLPLSASDYYKTPDYQRKKLKSNFKTLFLQHLRRKNLETPEYSTLSAAIPIMLWHIQGKSFSEIISLRHSFLTQKDIQREIVQQLKNNEISDTEASSLYNSLTIRFSQTPSTIPNKRHTRSSAFPYPNQHISKLDYDSLVYDTYDYLDKVISQSIADPICAVFELYYTRTKDVRARTLSNYTRYGTNDPTDIWLLKYGFCFEDIEWIKDHVEYIDQKRIHFKDSIYEIPEEKKTVVERYL
ncbi:DEAD/DEAH box helicase [Desulfovibrio subterraneus]|uniref:DEAD/DEAH box helicase n=1 Tax=Desulfovibrio subterraneus TaxID=2718620 RepID=UPI0022B8C490|nr:DEAD/DEAH box helicase [Desulfovibrio subterraneus]WBF66328.1 DEAD/DEAH box helicase [Desulfovibrio subterraneus]